LVGPLHDKALGEGSSRQKERGFRARTLSFTQDVRRVGLSSSPWSALKGRGRQINSMVTVLGRGGRRRRH